MSVTRVVKAVLMAVLVLAPLASAAPAVGGDPPPVTTLGDDLKVGGMGCG